MLALKSGSRRVWISWIEVTIVVVASACGKSTSPAGDSSDAGKKTQIQADASADAGPADAGTDASLRDATYRDPWPQLTAESIPEPIEVSAAFKLAEGPIWDHCGHRLLFSDVDAQIIHTLDTNDKVGEYFGPTNYANGLAFDTDGSLLLAEMGASDGGHISRLSAAPEKKLSVVADKDPLGKALGTSDDLVVRSDGTIYFTDPMFPHGMFATFSLGARPVYRLEPGPDPRRLVQEDMVAGPNGIELSPDEHTLYVAAYTMGNVLQYAVDKSGALTAEDPLITGLSTPDSLCVDVAGNVYVGVTGGLQVVSPDGRMVKLIPVTTARAVTNCSFGGDDGKTLYITAWTSLLKVEGMPIPGLDWSRNSDRITCPQ